MIFVTELNTYCNTVYRKYIRGMRAYHRFFFFLRYLRSQCDLALNMQGTQGPASSVMVACALSLMDTPYRGDQS